MKSSSLIVYACFVFVTLGINVALLGPSLRTHSLHTGASLSELAYLFTTLSIGYMLSMPVFARLDARGTTRLLMVAPAILAMSMTSLALSRTLAQVLLSALVMGFGQSVVQVGLTTMLGVHLHGQSDASARLNRVNAFYGVGALIGPVLAAISYRNTGESTSSVWVAVALSTLLLLIGLFTPVLRSGGSSQAREAIGEPESLRVLLRQPIIWIMSIFTGLYVGVEIAFSGWTTEFTFRSTGADLATAAIAASLFYAGLTLSRYFANVVVNRVPVALLLLLLCIVAGLGTAWMLFPGLTVPIAYAASLLVGMAYGPIFPTLISTVIRLFPGSAPKVSSVVTSAGSLGAIFVPAGIGIVLVQPNGMTLAWVLQLVVIAIMTLVWMTARRHLPK